MAHDDNYLTRNDRSREKALRDGEPWTPEDEAVLLAEWPRKAHEEEVAARLGRTIAACRQRYSALAGDHGIVHRPRVAEVTVHVCTGCWIALPATGVCDNCTEEN